MFKLFKVTDTNTYCFLSVCFNTVFLFNAYYLVLTVALTFTFV